MCVCVRVCARARVRGELMLDCVSVFARVCVCVKCVVAGVCLCGPGMTVSQQINRTLRPPLVFFLNCFFQSSTTLYLLVCPEAKMGVSRFLLGTDVGVFCLLTRM